MKHALFVLVLAVVLPAAAAPAPFTWKLETAKTTHYFVGSVHLLPQQAQPLPPAIEQALAASQVLVFESDIASISGDAAQAQMIPAAQNARGIRSEIASSTYARLQKRLEAMGLPGVLCDGFHAWFCSMTLEVMDFMKQGFQADLGIDEQLFRRASAAHRTVRWFEPLDQHLGLFTGMTASMSAELLESTLDEMELGEGSPDELLQVWQNNDLKALDDMTADMRRKHPLVYERLLAGRNRRWVPQLMEMVRGDKPVMVVVGAAHYAGPDGLLAQLRARGLQLQPAEQ